MTTVNVTANVTAGKGLVSGYAFRAPVGSTLPDNATEALDAAFVALGYISEDGITNSNSPESEDIKDLNGTPVLNVQSEKPDRWRASFIESLNLEVLKMVYGASNVSGTLATGISVTANAKALEAYSYVFDLVTSNGGLHRIVLPNARPAELGDIVYVNNDAVKYDVTLSALADTSGNTHYEYIKQA